MCGRAASFAQQHPETAQPVLACTAGSAVVGVVVGVGVAVYRKAPVHIYGLSVGANFALCSFTFFGEVNECSQYHTVLILHESVATCKLAL